MSQDEITAAVAKFLAGVYSGTKAKWSDEYESVGLCDDASDALVYWCGRNGIEAEIAHEARSIAGRSSSHTVVIIDGWTVDLTARQYDADADFPAIY